MNLREIRLDCAIKQKRGLHFIVASIVIWGLVFVIHITNLPILTKNLLTFCCTAPLLPLAFILSKLMKIDFKNVKNPLTNLGMLFSFNQIIYLLIAMWIYPTIPEKLVMVIAMIFGAHLLPFSWLYLSKVYMFFSIIIPFLALVVGLSFSPAILALVMIIIEIAFCMSLWIENKNLVPIE
ncbi:MULTISPECIES: DUF7010 family protein [unclassified Lysinibacillus]|uniref:DUF7010 family protein n=1 Tax=unclassified Lysinibacillus TaxID=2636778 RepID=UPI0035DC73F4